MEDFAVSLGAEIAKVQTELCTLRDEYLPKTTMQGGQCRFRLREFLLSEFAFLVQRLVVGLGLGQCDDSLVGSFKLLLEAGMCGEELPDRWHILQVRRIAQDLDDHRLAKVFRFTF